MNTQNSAMELFINRVKNVRELCGFLEKPGSPIIRRNEEGLIHAIKKPAYVSYTQISYYENGKQHGPTMDRFGSISYYFNGVLIPSEFYLNKDIKLEKILKHPNVEVRGVGLRIYGYDRLELENIFKLIDKNEDKQRFLYRFCHTAFEKPIHFIKLTDCSPEADGTFKIVYLCVPNDIFDVDEAVAWTFYMTKEEYILERET